MNKKLLMQASLAQKLPTQLTTEHLHSSQHFLSTNFPRCVRTLFKSRVPFRIRKSRRWQEMSNSVSRSRKFAWTDVTVARKRVHEKTALSVQTRNACAYTHVNVSGNNSPTERERSYVFATCVYRQIEADKFRLVQMYVSPEHNLRNTRILHQFSSG